MILKYEASQTSYTYMDSFIPVSGNSRFCFEKSEYVSSVAVHLRQLISPVDRYQRYSRSYFSSRWNTSWCYQHTSLWVYCGVVLTLHRISVLLHVANASVPFFLPQAESPWLPPDTVELKHWRVFEIKCWKSEDDKILRRTRGLEVGYFHHWLHINVESIRRRSSIPTTTMSTQPSSSSQGPLIFEKQSPHYPYLSSGFSSVVNNLVVPPDTH